MPAIVEPDVGRIGVRDAATKIRDDPGLLRAALMSLRDRRSTLASVAARSSLHPNGFAKVVLQVGNDWSIRLHVWGPTLRPRVLDAKPHGHRWEFASWVMAGVLRETTFQRAASGELFDVCDYGRNADGSAYLRARGRATLSPGARFDHLAGTVYQRSGSILHTAEPISDGLVASLVVQGRRSRPSTHVYLRPGSPPVHQERALSVGQVSTLLEDVIEVVR
jgi:hypothetical protein